ncbi:MAG: hypothetical protein ABL962_18000, partial [Fimbriimonadaceae bacterium]
MEGTSAHSNTTLNYGDLSLDVVALRDSLLATAGADTDFTLTFLAYCQTLRSDSVSISTAVYKPKTGAPQQLGKTVVIADNANKVTVKAPVYAATYFTGKKEDLLGQLILTFERTDATLQWFNSEYRHLSDYLALSLGQGFASTKMLASGSLEVPLLHLLGQLATLRRSIVDRARALHSPTLTVSMNKEDGGLNHVNEAFAQMYLKCVTKPDGSNPLGPLDGAETARLDKQLYGSLKRFLEDKRFLTNAPVEGLPE